MKTLYTTVLLRSGELNEMRGFCYQQGDTLSFVPSRIVIASSVETNMIAANQVPSSFRSFAVSTFDWRIPVEALADYQDDHVLYRVTREDVQEFATKAYVAFYAGGDKPFIEVVPAAKPITFDGKEYKQVMGDFKELSLHIGRLEKFWASIDWCHGIAPKFGGVIPVVLTLTELDHETLSNEKP